VRQPSYNTPRLTMKSGTNGAVKQLNRAVAQSSVISGDTTMIMTGARRRTGADAIGNLELYQSCRAAGGRCWSFSILLVAFDFLKGPLGLGGQPILSGRPDWIPITLHKSAGKVEKTMTKLACGYG
jgi:hypothetical protein